MNSITIGESHYFKRSYLRQNAFILQNINSYKEKIEQRYNFIKIVSHKYSPV